MMGGLKKSVEAAWFLWLDVRFGFLGLASLPWCGDVLDHPMVRPLALRVFLHVLVECLARTEVHQANTPYADTGLLQFDLVVSPN